MSYIPFSKFITRLSLWSKNYSYKLKSYIFEKINKPYEKNNLHIVTYKDLVKERKAVWELLKRYDVNIVGMEEFGARKDSPLTTCLKEVEQSNIYLVLLPIVGEV